jgi:hypothetical protein
MSKKEKSRVNVVYSTNPDFQFQHESEDEPDTLANNQQRLYQLCFLRKSIIINSNKYIK